jgi:hypothetical protein
MTLSYVIEKGVASTTKLPSAIGLAVVCKVGVVVVPVGAFTEAVGDAVIVGVDVAVPVGLLKEAVGDVVAIVGVDVPVPVGSLKEAVGDAVTIVGVDVAVPVGSFTEAVGDKTVGVDVAVPEGSFTEAVGDSVVKVGVDVSIPVGAATTFAVGSRVVSDEGWANGLSDGEATRGMVGVDEATAAGISLVIALGTNTDGTRDGTALIESSFDFLLAFVTY